jgi:NAD-dependent deacetylase
MSEIVELDDVRRLLRLPRPCVVLTGAGISAESGIPTFRDALTGLWARFSAERLATPEAFARDPALVWGWYEWRRAKVLQAEPNAAHRAIALWARDRADITIVTQNVDDLHERAGAQNIIHLHGSLHQPRCAACSLEHVLPNIIPEEPEGWRRLDPPRCLHCGGRVRPGIVWFGENLPQSAWAAAEKAARQCRLLLSIGTSSLVSPAADLPIIAARHGATIVQVNPQPTPLDSIADFSLRGAAGEILPKILSPPLTTRRRRTRHFAFLVPSSVCMRATTSGGVA